MMTLHPNEIKPRYILTIVIFSVLRKSAQTSSEHLGTFSAKFRSLWKVVGNL